MSGCSSADLDGRAHALVLVGRRHPDVDDREIGLVLGDGGEERLTVADTRDHGVAGVLEQSCESLAQEHGILGDHDSHGIATSTVVPPPRGLAMSKRAAVRCNPVPETGEPDPRRTVAPPTPSSETLTRKVASSRTARTATFDADPCLTAFVIASHATK